MGLIDYLGKWNMNKRLEMYGKSILAHFIRQNTDFSVKPPHEFARRFLKKVKRIFRVQKSQKNGVSGAGMMGNNNQSMGIPDYRTTFSGIGDMTLRSTYGNLNDPGLSNNSLS